MSIFNALVIGYYNKNNLGDESYRHIMPSFFPNHSLTFVNSHDLSLIDSSDYQCVIVGGGDIINDYFNDKIKPFLDKYTGTTIAFSVGIPFPNLITREYLSCYDHVFTRNYEDLRPLQRILGAHNVHFIPDIALSYPSPPKAITNRTCGIFLVGNLIKYPEIVNDISQLVSKLSLSYRIILYCFNPDEDVEISRQVRSKALERLRSSYTDDEKLSRRLSRCQHDSNIVVDEKYYHPHEMLTIISELRFAICMRYHSHIFCTVAKTPFMSISSTRKTRSFMEQTGLSSYQYKLPLDNNSNPTTSNYLTMKKICRETLRNKDNISLQLGHFLQQSKTLLSTNQASAILSSRCRSVEENTLEFIKDTGDYENASRILSNYVTGSPDSPCIWGLSKKLEESQNLSSTITENIDYLVDIEFSAEDMEPNGTLPVNIDINEYSSYKDAHRGGWHVTAQLLHELSSYNGVICDMYVDRTFHWCNSYMKYRGIIPYTGPWCGFIHHTQDTTYSPYNTEVLFENKEFIQSLHTCFALFVLSESLASYLRKKIKSIAPGVKIVTFSHPVVYPDNNFTPSYFCGNSERKLINIGSWLRNPFTIYRLSNVPIKRAILIGKNMDDHLPPENFKLMYADEDISQEEEFTALTPVTPCRHHSNVPRWVSMVKKWLESIGIVPVYYEDSVLYIQPSEYIKISIEEINNNIVRMINQVEVITYKSNKDYDDLLSENVVFLDLIDAAAVNTIIECIVRRTPVIVNKIPGTVALLGEEYPLFYTDIAQVASLINLPVLNMAHNYLANLDTTQYDISVFAKHFGEVMLELEATL